MLIILNIHNTNLLGLNIAISRNVFSQSKLYQNVFAARAPLSAPQGELMTLLRLLNRL